MNHVILLAALTMPSASEMRQIPVPPLAKMVIDMEAYRMANGTIYIDINVQKLVTLPDGTTILGFKLWQRDNPGWFVIGGPLAWKMVKDAP